MAGYEFDETVYRLTFEKRPGLKVAIFEPVTDDLLTLQELQDGDGSGEDGRKMFRILAGYLESWNVERKGEPVPATYEGLLSLPLSFQKELIDAWLNAVTGVEPPLSSASGSGGSSPEASLQLASASAPLPS